jgi:hypothetical protein
LSDQSIDHTERRTQMARIPRLRAAYFTVGAGAVGALVTGLGLQPASAATHVPFKAVYSGTFIPTDTGFNVSGAGHATKLGSSTNQGTVVMLSQPNESCPTTGFVVTNDETLIAANGDQVTLTILDKRCPVAGEPGIYDGVSTYHITGGSGRFADATGEGTFDGRGDFNFPNNLTFTYTFDGTISVPNGD